MSLRTSSFYGDKYARLHLTKYTKNAFSWKWDCNLVSDGKCKLKIRHRLGELTTQRPGVKKG